jgi:hypothetical protein
MSVRQFVSQGRAGPVIGPCEVCSVTISPAGRVRLARRKLYQSPPADLLQQIMAWEKKVAAARGVAVFSACLAWPGDGKPRPSDEEVMAIALGAAGGV